MTVASLGATASMMFASASPASACDPTICSNPPCMVGTEDIDCGETGDNGGSQTVIGNFRYVGTESDGTDLWEYLNPWESSYDEQQTLVDQGQYACGFDLVMGTAVCRCI